MNLFKRLVPGLAVVIASGLVMMATELYGSEDALEPINCNGSRDNLCNEYTVCGGIGVRVCRTTYYYWTP